MLRSSASRFSLIALATGLISSPCLATDYDESVSGDFSNSGLTATNIGVLTPGANQIFGSTGRGSAGIDRDYLTLTVPSGYNLISLTQLPGTVIGGSFSFIGMQGGSQVTVSPNTTTAAGLMGWTHYSAGDTGTDILPRMGISSNGSAGFQTPLGAGNYSFWIQDFNTGPLNYKFSFGVAAVPEPGTPALLIGFGCVGSYFGLLRARKQR